MISVKVKNIQWDRRDSYGCYIEEFNHYTGEVVPNPRWVNADQFCLSTGDAKFPFRVIDKDRVVGSDYVKKVEAKIRTISVPGSKPGQSYLVTLNGSNSSCTCIGFGFRKSCKHIGMAEELRD